MVTGAAFSKADDRHFRSNRRLFYTIILATAACLAVQGHKGQPYGEPRKSFTKGTGLELVLDTTKNMIEILS